ncbi:3-hydroxyacyl-CoA dehydrogenase [Kordiimonas sediminis]|uniref:3-hydroxyacyl-CoA dehydrogenase n=1 Tax=Kordiimonas sediminis TaxID=1735581 RepID=A0A919B050_9PROT|nr:3-hydroxyacyl-CoA dehydrogenase NAD-binding domain-containing protein [Kordiimonas sediminis]GHF31112.1 3-hydroxyacyl-CoA dehydrogenase [Kordiimonas sediminis]
MSPITREDIGEIAVLSCDYPPVNALSHAVRKGYIDHLDAIRSDDAIKAVVVRCEGRTFHAGADITEFGKPPQEPHLPDVVMALETFPKPLVAAIHGTALGGGLEIALGCHYRIADPSAKVGLPEVHLGILPGAGGTQRLPRLAGVENALDAILSGRHVKMKEAAAWGVVDRLAGDDLKADAVAYAKEVVASGPRPTGDIELDGAKYDEAFFANFRKSIARKTRGFFAPEQCIRCVEAAVSLPLVEGLKKERQYFTECMQNPEAAAMRHLFFAERQVARVPGITKETKRRDIKKVGIIGAGTMGGGIAMNFANVGIPVTVLELNQEALDRGLGVCRKNWERSSRLTADDVAERVKYLSGTTNYEDLADCDLVIEAVFEKMEIKEQVFKKLDEVLKPGAIMASNTSYLDVDAIAAYTSRPSDVLGLHFFSPANVMKLLEIVRGKETADDVLATCLDMAKKIGKVGVVAGVCHGFIGNRMLSGYGREANLNVMKGAMPQDVDKAIFDFGMPMGPLTMADMAGLDIGYFNRQSMDRNSFDTRATDWLDRLVEGDRKGLKVGKGIYDYAEGSRAPVPSPEVEAIILEESAKLGLERTSISAEEIVERSIYALINEGAHILDEGIALRASDIDVVYVYGYGFPRYRGGPMHYADAVGLDKVYARLQEFASIDPDNWKISPLLKRLAEEGSSFAAFDQSR